MLEKDKNCIEFSMHSMMATHKPYQEDTEIAITGMAPGKSLLLANNPFDIPCDVVVVSRSYFEALQTENEQLKKKLAVPDPLPEFRELLEKLYSKDDAENLEWTLNHICGGRDSYNGWISISLFWKRKYKALSRIVGFSSTEEIQDYLTNEAKCDTLHEAVSKLKDQVKYTCDEWYSANSTNNSWKAAAECNSPKELIEKLNLLRDDISGRSTVIESYKRDIDKWQEATGCDRPEDISTSSLFAKATQASWRYAYDEIKKANEKLAESVEKLKEEIVSWKNVTGYSTPESYMAAKLNIVWQDATGELICGRDLRHTLQVDLEYYRTLSTVQAKSIYGWKEATGCDAPDQVKTRIEGLENAVRLTNRNMIKEIKSDIDEWQKFTGCDTPQKAGCKINGLCDDICKLKGDYDHLLGLTGYKTEQDIRVALNYREQFVYETMRELINSLKRKEKFTESNWQTATGCDTPGRAEEKLESLYSRIDKMKEAASIASNWTDKIVED